VADGLIQTSAGLAELSAAMPILIDAQTAMLSGLSDAMEELAFFKLDPGLPVSFTDPDNPAPVSVQFIYVIPGF